MKENNAPQARTVVLSELIEELCRLTDTDSATAKAFTLDFFTTIEEALAAGEKVIIKGIGRFSYEGGNVVFTPDNTLAEAVNEPFSMFEPVELAPGGALELNEEDSDYPGNDEISVSESIVGQAPQGKWMDEFQPETEYHESEEEQPGSEPSEDDSNDKVMETVVTDQEETSALTSKNVVVDSQPAPEYPAAVATEPAASPAAETPAVQAGEPSKTHTASKGLTSGEPMLVERIHIKEVHRGLNKSSACLMAILMFIAGWVACIFIQPILANLYNSYTYSPLPESKLMTETTKVKEQTDTPTALAKPEAHAEPALKQTAAPTEVYDTVTAKRYLTTIARDHYGSRDKWVIIYEANKDVITNPDVIAPGTIVRVPPLDTVR
ncbi:MAG: HU family DNA-binding protein [Muribaculaceae bacterium]|nr:HU family DNA-binding protein [Muribaculaceae bacterium]